MTGNPNASTRTGGFGGEWLFLIGGLAVLGAILVYVLNTERVDIEQRERERLTNQTRVVNDNLVRQLASIHRALLSVRDELPRWRAEKDGRERANRRLSAFSDAMTGVRTMMVMDAEGRIVACNRPELLGRNVAKREYFAWPRDGGDAGMLYVSPPFRTLLGNYVINVSVTVLDASGNFDGVVSAALDPDEFKILLESVRYAPDMRSFLVHGDGLLFVMMPERPELVGTSLAQPGSMFSRHLESGEAATVQTGRVLLTGEERMLAVRTVMPAEPRLNKPLVVTASRDLAALGMAWRKEARFVGALYAVVAFVSAATLFIVQRRRRRADEVLRAAEAELRESTAELEGFFNVTPDLLCIADMDGRFRKLNPSWERTLGYPLARLEGERFLDYVHPDDVEATLAAVASQARGERIINFVNRYRCADGSYRDIEWHSAPHGELIHAAARDVTEQRRALRELSAAKLTADAANQAKSEFLANMSHEIRTPLNAVIGLMQLIERTALTPRQADYVAKAQSAAQSLLGIINDVLDFSKVEAGKVVVERVAFRLDTLLDNLSVVLATAAKDKSIAVSFVVAPEVPRFLVGDSLRLQQVLLNLGGNAIKFTEVGEVVIGIREVERDRDGARIEFAVRDTGIGIPEDKLQAIFEAFTQAEASTTRRFGGTGLGLAISQRLVRLMGGGLRVESAPGRGSCFSFVLGFPLADEAALPSEAAAPNPAVCNGRRLSGLRVLLVEDNLMNQLVARDLLIQEGAHVEVANNGREGVERVRDAETPFDAVLMDVQMPVMDGYAATRALREQYGLRDLPIIAMTANALPADRATCLAAGMSDHVGKPFALADLVGVLARHCPRLGGATAVSPSPLPPPPAVAASPDFDVAAALTRLENNGEMYLRIIDSFRKGESALREELRVALAAGNVAVAARTLHTLKGLAATLGATRLSAFARMAEAGVKDGGADHARLPAELDMELALACDELDRIAAQLAAPAPSVPASAAGGGPVPVERMAGFVALLEAGNMRALDEYRALKRDYPGSCGGHAEELDAALARLDFAAAAALCRDSRGVS